jgi:hypothetical protein
MAQSNLIRRGSIILAKLAPLVLGLLLGLTLLRSELDVGVDITRLLNFQQFVFVYLILYIAILGFIEARGMQKARGGGVEAVDLGVVIAYSLAFIGLGLTIFIFVADYQFNNSDLDIWIGIYLLAGAILILINSRQQLFTKDG